YDIRTAVPPMLSRVRAAFLAELEERLAPLDLNPADYLVLVALANDVADTASTVCSVMAHDPGAMTRKIDALEKRGLVRRVRSAEDRRAIKLELTAEGRKLYPQVRAAAVGRRDARAARYGRFPGRARRSRKPARPDRPASAQPLCDVGPARGHREAARRGIRPCARRPRPA